MRRMGAAACLAAAAIVFSACGLEITPVLDPPDAPEALASDTTPVFQVVNLPTTVPSDWYFELKYGFELYYKFYDRNQTKEEKLNDQGALIAAGYRRVNTTGSLSAQVLPLIPINVADQNTEFDVTLDFAQPVASRATYNVGDPAPVIEVRRGVEHLGSAKTFAREDLDPSDADVSEIWTQAVSDGEIHLAMYALTYGLYDLSIPLYSTARYLGFMVYHDIS